MSPRAPLGFDHMLLHQLEKLVVPNTGARAARFRHGKKKLSKRKRKRLSNAGLFPQFGHSGQAVR